MNFNKRCISKEEFKKYDIAHSLHVRDSLKPNDYFRTFAGQIYKSMNVSPIKGNKIYYANGDYTWVDILVVANFSDKLIDLIEIGDYVNGSKVLDISEDENNRIWIYTDSKNNECCFSESEIEDVVTKEQFNSRKYVVGEIND